MFKGREFQNFEPAYDRDFLHSSILGLGTKRSLCSYDLNDLCSILYFKLAQPTPKRFKTVRKSFHLHRAARKIEKYAKVINIYTL
jgi:hypothetical protein